MVLVHHRNQKRPTGPRTGPFGGDARGRWGIRGACARGKGAPIIPVDVWALSLHLFQVPPVGAHLGAGVCWLFSTPHCTTCFSPQEPRATQGLGPLETPGRSAWLPPSPMFLLRDRRGRVGALA